MAGDDVDPERKPDEDAWIEKVVKLATSIGMNPMRTRWKLIRWQERRRQAKRRLAQKVDHVRYEHKTCDTCGAVQDRDDKQCSHCGARLGARGFQVLRRIGLVMPEAISISTVLALAIVGVYAREILAAGGGLSSPSSGLLYQLGGHLSAAVPDEPWRLVTAIFLHASFWHVGFNMVAIAQIGPQVEELYGRMTMLFLFIATGILANIGSGAVGLHGVGIGASGGVMGLIGVAAGYGQRLGTGRGRSLRDDMLKWSAYTFVFGYFVHADNWAHLFGLVTGAAFGYAVRPQAWSRPALLPVRFLAKLAGSVLAIGALATIFTRHPSAVSGLGDGTWQPNARACRMYFDGDVTSARLALRVLYDKKPSFDLGDSGIDQHCRSFLATRQWCQDHDGSMEPSDRVECNLIIKAFGSFPELPTTVSLPPR